MKFELFKVKEIFFHLDFALSSEREQAAFRQMPIYLFYLFILFLFLYLFFLLQEDCLLSLFTLSDNKSLQFFFLKQKIQGEF